MLEENLFTNLPKSWNQLERHDYGFAVSYPRDWEVVYPGKEFAVVPNWARQVFDPELGRKVPSPAVSIIITACTDPDENMALNFERTQSIGYKRYKIIKQHSYKITGARHLLAYEFQFDLGDDRWTALSLLVQRGVEMFEITASASLGDFEKQRAMIERIIFSFRLIPGYAQLPWTDPHET